MEEIQKKKILYVITKSNFKGAQKYTLELALSSKKLGHEVVVAFGGTGEKGAGSGELGAKLREHSIETIHVRHFVRNISFVDDVSSLFELITILKNVKPDVVHLSSSKAGGVGALAARITGVGRIIFTSHGLAYDESWRPMWQRGLILIATWFTILLTHKTIMISKNTEDRAGALFFCKNKIVLIYNGIREINFLEREVAHKEMDLPNIPEGHLVLGTIGELHPNKNIASVLTAIRDMNETNRKLHFVIMGSGELEDELKSQVKEFGLESLVSFFKSNEASKYLKALDIFILPSFKEGLPYVLLEAGLASLPTIASNIDGNTDIIKDRETGLLVNPTEPKDIEGSVLELINNAELRENLGTSLRHSVLATFSIEKMLSETQSLYNK